MKESEKRSAVHPDTDVYLQAHREMTAALVAKQRNWNGLDYAERHADVISWQSIDPHLAECKQQLQRSSVLLTEDQRAYFAERIADARKDWLERREHAKLTVKLADLAGEDVPPDIRELATGPDMFAVYEGAREQMVASRRRSLQRVLAAG